MNTLESFNQEVRNFLDTNRQDDTGVLVIVEQEDLFSIRRSNVDLKLHRVIALLSIIAENIDLIADVGLVEEILDAIREGKED